MADEVAGAYVTIQPDLGGFEAELDSKLRGAMAGASADVHVGADTADAQAKLDAVQANLDHWAMSHGAATADVDTGRAEAKLDEISAKLDEFGHKRATATADVNTSGAQSGVSLLVSGLLALGPAATVAAGMAVAGLAALPAILGGAALGAGALVLGFHGVGTALQAMDKAQATSAQTSAQAGLQRLADAQAEQQAAKGVQAAQEQLANAERQAAQDRVSSAEAVARAEQTLADAQRQQAADAVTQAEAVATAEQGLADAQRQQANDAITRAEAVATAEQALAQARQTADQQVAAAEQGLQTAEAGLTQAVYNEQQAQQSLIAARQTAQRQLESYQQQVADGALAQRAAILQVQQAKANLDAAIANPKATQLQVEQAQLAYDQAVQQQKDQAANYANLQQDAAAAAKAGVDGATGVLNAQHQLGQATQGVADAQANIAKAQQAVTQAQAQAVTQVAAAQQHLADVQRQNAQQQITDSERVTAAQQRVADVQRQNAAQQAADAERIGNAERGVADARRQQANQATADAQRIADAQRSVAQAQQQVADTQARVALQSRNAATGTSAVTQAMAGLGPAGQQFVTWFHGNFEPVLKQMRDADQQALLPGIQAAMTTLLPVLADIQPFLIEAATGIAQWAQALATWLAGPQGMGDLNTILGAGVGFMQSLGNAALSVIQAIGNLGAQAAPIVGMMGQSVQHVADAFLHWTVDGGSQKFLTWVQANAPALMHFFDTVAHTVVDWGKGAATLAPLELSILNSVAPLLDAIVKANPAFTGFVTMFGGFALAASKLAGPIKTVGDVVSGGMDFVKMVGGAAKAEGAIGRIAGGVRALGISMGILSAAEEGVTVATDEATVGFTLLDAVPIVALIVGIIAAIAALVFGIYELVTHWREVWDAISGAAVAVWGFISGHWKLFAALFGPVGWMAIAIDWLVTHWSEVWGAIQTVASTVWNAISGFFTAAWQTFTSFVGSTWATIRDDIIGPIVWLWDTTTGALAKAWNALAGWLAGVWNAFETWVSSIWGAIVGGVVAAWNAVFDTTKGILYGAWHAIRTFFEAEWNGWVTIVSGIWGLIGGAITGVWDGIRTAAGALWDDIKKAFVAGVNDVIDVANFFITVLDKVLGFFHLPTIDKLSHWTQGEAATPTGPPIRIPGGAAQAFATGGTVAGPGSGDTVPAWLSPGEYVVQAPVVSDLGVGFFDKLNAGGYLLGGFIHDVGGAASSAWGAVSGAAGAVGGLIEKGASKLAQAALDAAMAGVGALVQRVPAGFMHDMAQGMVDDLHSLAQRIIGGGQQREPTANVPGSALPTGQHLDIIRRALLAAGKADTAPNEGALNIIVSGESSWVPDTVNRWDSNWARGTPSVGLGQVIGPTFREYAGAYVDTQPQMYGVSVDPVANLVAAINYAFSRYGGLTGVPGVRAVSSGQPYVGYDDGGWLPSGGVLPVNTTGRPEAVLDPAESAAFLDLARRAGATDELVEEMRAMREGQDRLAAAFERQVDRQLLLARTGARGR